MPIKWKDKSRFKPDVILRKIDSVMTVNPNDEITFTGFDLEDCLPALQSMLAFPDAASEFDTSDMVWSALSAAGKGLTPSSFLTAINNELSNSLATKELSYHLLTTISLNSRDIPKISKVLGVEICVLPANFSSRYKSRETLIENHSTFLEPTPTNYCKLVIKVKAKSPGGAVDKALRGLDLQRSLWCLMGNPRLELTYGTAAYSPINVVRLGGEHTLHFTTGMPVTDGIWFDPGFVSTKIHRMAKPGIIKRNCRWILRQIANCHYKDSLTSSLIRFVRALDERNANTAFLRLWGALEVLTTPGQANYENLVRRCSFLFRENDYHRQLLEHLREYRNSNIHAGEESKRARTHCYQLQLYFVNLIWFHLRNAKFFDTLEEANSFLDLPNDKNYLKRRLTLTNKAVRFIK